MLNNIITTVLKREGKVALPSIGIIVRADFDGETTYLFTPMAAKADSKVIAAIVADMELEPNEAANVLECYMDFVRGVIVKNGKYHIKDVGDILQNDNNVYYFTALNVVPSVAPVATIVEEVKEAVLEEQIIAEEIEESEPEVVKETVVREITVEEPVIEEMVIEESEEVKAERMNERFQSKRLGEIIEGGANKRFYDKVHSQVITEKEEVKSEPVKEEVQPPKRKGLYDIYDKGFKHDTPPVVRTAVTPPPAPPTLPTPVVEAAVASVVVSAPVEPQVEVTETVPKKKTDFVLIISIIVIIVGLAFIGYFYYMQQNIEL